MTIDNRQSTIVNLPSPLPMQAEEIEILTPRDRVMIDDWMEANYRLPKKTSDVTGLYSFDYTPFFREPMRRLSEPPVKVGIEACIQGGKSTLLVAVFGYITDQDPGPTLFIMPRETDTKRRVNTRIKPMFEENTYLLRHLPGGEIRNFNIGSETVFDNMIAFLAWAGSPPSMADNPICNILADEPGKWKILLSGEDSLESLDERTRTFWLHSRFFYVTSPQNEGDTADRQFRNGSDERWAVPCMLCGQWHFIKASKETLYIEKDKDGRFFEAAAYKEGDAKSAYTCPHCKKHFSELQRVQSNANGVWVARGQAIAKDGKITGDRPIGNHYTYRVNSLMLHTRFWQVRREVEKFVAAIKEQKSGNLESLRNYTRNQRAEPWKEIGKVIETSSIIIKRGNYDYGRVPPDVKILVAGADYHEDQQGNVRADWIVKGFADDMVNYDIAYGQTDLEEMARLTTHHSFEWAQRTDQKELMLLCGFIDSNFDSDTIYQFCRQYRNIWIPVRGGTAAQAGYFHISDLDKVVSEARRKYRRKYAGQYRGMKLLTLNVNYFKDIVAKWAEEAAGHPGCTYYYSQMPDEFFEELTNEHKKLIKSGSRMHWGWEPKKEGSPTHGLDISVYATAAGYFKNVFDLYSPETKQKIAEAMQARMPARARRRIGTINRY